MLASISGAKLSSSYNTDQVCADDYGSHKGNGPLRLIHSFPPHPSIFYTAFLYKEGHCVLQPILEAISTRQRITKAKAPYRHKVHTMSNLETPRYICQSAWLGTMEGYQRKLANSTDT